MHTSPTNHGSARLRTARLAGLHQGQVRDHDARRGDDDADHGDDEGPASTRPRARPNGRSHRRRRAAPGPAHEAGAPSASAGPVPAAASSASRIPERRPLASSRASRMPLRRLGGMRLYSLLVTLKSSFMAGTIAGQRPGTAQATAPSSRRRGGPPAGHEQHIPGAIRSRTQPTASTTRTPAIPAPRARYVIRVSTLMPSDYGRAHHGRGGTSQVKALTPQLHQETAGQENPRHAGLELWMAAYGHQIVGRPANWFD